ncbi:MAG: class I SAM-dependent methyltransferase [Rhodospirillaceae bacterium]|nr:MAG: class I SAM-dependent methyltransferase [Rhodospirillaceae bacterium]
MSEEAGRIIDLYRRRALDFDRERGRSLFEKSWLDRFLAGLPPGGRVLDLGCGSGEPIARYLIEHGLAVTGIDTSPALLDLCRTRFPRHQWLLTDMRDPADELHGEAPFDGLVAWDSFFHLTAEDQRRMFAVFRRHAAPGAALLFTSGPAAGEAIGVFHGEALYHASLDGDDYRALLAAHGFAVIDHVVEDPDCGGHTVWLAKRG